MYHDSIVRVQIDELFHLPTIQTKQNKNISVKNPLFSFHTDVKELNFVSHLPIHLYVEVLL